MTKPIINSFSSIAPLIIQKYERYLPTAFDESLTILQKVNKIIKYLDDTGLLVGGVVTQWNTVMEWVMNEGLDDSVTKKLDDMLADGTFNELINQVLFGALDDRIKTLEDLKLGDKPVSISSFGAKGDGVTDDTQAFKDAILSGKTIELKDGATYVISSVLSVTDQHLRWFCNGNATILNTIGGTLLTFKNTEKTHVQLSSVTLNSTMSKITLPNVTNIQVGDLIKFQSSAPWYYDPRPDGVGGYSTYKGEVHLIKEINGNEITLDCYFGDTYNTSEVIDVYVYSPKTIEFKGITFKLPNPVYTQMFYIYDAYRPLFDRVNIINSQRAGAIIYTSYSPEVKGCHINLNINDSAIIDTGYGIQDYGCVFGKYHDNTFTSCRRGVDFSGIIPSRWGLCHDNTFTCLAKYYVNVPGITGFGTHGGCENTLFANNTINGAESAFKIRGNMCKIIGNIGINLKNEFAYMEFGGQNYVENNTVQSDGDVPDYFVTLANTIDSVRTVIKNNHGRINQHIVYHYTPTTTKLQFDMSGNVFNTGTDKNIIFVSGIPTGTNVTFEKSNIVNNQIIPDSRYRYNVNNLLIDWTNTEIEGYVLPTSFYKVGFGLGTLSNVTLDMLVNKRGRIVQLTGVLKFDVNGDTARPHITGLPNPNSGFSNHRLMLSTANTQHVIQKVRNSDEIQVSGTGTSHQDAFPVGTGYAIIIDMSYQLVG
jgi:hypothetical protein